MTTTSALKQAREHAGATVESLGEAVEELVHEAKDLLDRELPVLADKASGTAGALAGELANRASALFEESGDKVVAARRELAARIDPGTPSSRRWWWIGAGIAVTVASVIGWLVLARRPQEVPLTEAPPTSPPGTVDVEAGRPAQAARTGHS